jgi:hypothetical protein
MGVDTPWMPDIIIRVSAALLWDAVATAADVAMSTAFGVAPISRVLRW